MLTWASRMGEEVAAKPQLSKLSMPPLETLTRDEIDLMERVLDSERDKLIIRYLLALASRITREEHIVV